LKEIIGRLANRQVDNTVRERRRVIRMSKEAEKRRLADAWLAGNLQCDA
jgi:hypothetical protein